MFHDKQRRSCKILDADAVASTVTVSARRRACTALRLGGGVIHKTGSRYYIATPPEENRATAIGDVHK